MVTLSAKKQNQTSGIPFYSEFEGFVTCQAILSADHTSAVRGNAHFYPWSDFYFKSVKNFMPHIIKGITVSF